MIILSLSILIHVLRFITISPLKERKQNYNDFQKNKINKIYSFKENEKKSYLYSWAFILSTLL